MSEDLDKVLKDIEAEKQVRLQEQEKAREMLQVDEETANQLIEQRKSKISGFKLDLKTEENSGDEGAENQPDSREAQAAPKPPVVRKTPAAEETPNIKVAPAESRTKEQPESKSAAASATAQAVEPASAAQMQEHTENANRQDIPPHTDVEKDKRNPGGAVHTEVRKAGGKTPAAEGNKVKSGSKKQEPGCLKGIIYGAIVLVLSVAFAFVIIVGGLDYTGLNKSDTKVPVTLTEDQCKSTSEVAKALKKAGVIEQPLFFELYCKISKAGGKFQPQDELALSADMGYGAIISALESTTRNVVSVTFPEGSTVQDIAAKLEANKVCSSTEFLNALNSDNYSYDFLNEIPTDDAHAGRFYKLEGYLFPDTYQFYVGSSGETVVNKFLDNFNTRVSISVRTAMKAKGMTLDDTITLASIIQWEGNDKTSMQGISYVLHSRLSDPTDYPKLECDSTRRYINTMEPPSNGVQVDNPDYDTYKRTGLPVGPINSPGMDAIDAAINPSIDSKYTGSFFYATDMKSGVTYYSKTYAQHVSVCKKYGIGMYANQ